MDLGTKLNHLAQARRHVAIGEDHIARQAELIDMLVRDGHDAGEARRLLARFIVLQAIHIDNCGRLERELVEQPEPSNITGRRAAAPARG
jgi:hypothetical protein